MDCECFKCGEVIDSAAGDDPWVCPGGAVQFDGGWSFGSALYDAGMDGISVQINICDTCLKGNQDNHAALKEIQNDVNWVRHQMFPGDDRFYVIYNKSEIVTVGTKAICEDRFTEIAEELRGDFEVISSVEFAKKYIKETQDE